MYKVFQNGFAALALAATVAGGLAATPAFADPDHDRGRGHGRWDHDRGYERHDRGPDRVVVVRDRGPDYYDWNRPDPRYGRYYRPERYYRGGYRPVVVTRETRIYHGDDGRYYCRRSDGTTGLIVGAVLGGVVGDRLDRGRSSVLGAILGAGAGAAIGSSIDRGQVVCR
jgi:uncharacterized protein YcfJ